MGAGKLRVPPAFMKVRKRRRPFRVERLLEKQQASEATPWSESARAARLLKMGAIGDPPKLKTQLLPHQERVIERLKNQEGLVVAHGLGSGKTLSSIGAIVDLNPQEARVVVPASLQENYRKEVEKHVQGQLPVKVESLQKAVKDGNPPRGDLVVVDEAHRIRNPTSKGYRLMRDLGEGKRMLLTASPVYNLPEDVAPLVNVAAGEDVLPEGAEFRQRYVQKPGRSIFTIINPWASKDPKIVHKKELGQVLNKWVDYHGNSEEGYPALEQERINVPMTKHQSKLHADAWGELPWIARMRLKKGLPADKKDLAALNRFQSQTRQISSSTKKYELEGVQHEISPKVEEAVDRLKTKMDTNPEHKALVYANYLGTLDDYSKRLEEENVPHAFFRGDTSKKVRDQAIRDFNEGKVKALLVSGAGGEGLDLKGTRQVQVLEPHWNEEKLRQVIGRARRYQSHDHLPENERTVTVERYAAQPRTLFGTKKGIEDILYDTAAQKQRLNDQVLNLITKTGAVVAPKSGEFAPGIPQDRKIESIQRIREKGKNYDWDLSVTHHPAERRGDHLDLRLVDQKGRAHSWALPAELPRPGKSSYAVQQPTHTKEYALKEEPFELPEGYGKTRPGALVTPIALGKAEVVAANNHKVRFVHHRGGESQEFVLRKIDAKAPGAGPMWALHNATKNVHTLEGKKLPQYRRKYTAVEPEDVDTADDSQVMTAKIDGAHTLTALHGDKGFNRIYSYRKPAARETGVIEHTMKVPDFHKQRSPKDLKGTILRTEMWFSDKDGKPLPAAQVGGLLNSGVLKSRTKQEELGVKPRLTVIDVDRFKGRKVEDKPFEQKLEMMREVVDKVDMLELPPMARTQAEKEKLLKDLKAGRVRETKEGVVLRDLKAPGDVPTKAVFKPLHDVYVRDIFTKERGEARGHAGGFAYSWSPDGPVVGRVGTGFDHAMRREMLENPDKFVGRVAMVKSPGVTPKGALRGAPSFKGWHPDKNDPELMKEAATRQIKILRKLVAQGRIREAQEMAQQLADAGVLKVSGPGTNLSRLGFGAEAIVDLVAGAGGSKLTQKTPLTVRKVFDQQGPLYSNEQLAEKVNFLRRMNNPKVREGLPEGALDFAKIHGGIRRTEGGAKYTLHEFVPESAQSVLSPTQFKSGRVMREPGRKIEHGGKTIDPVAARKEKRDVVVDELRRRGASAEIASEEAERMIPRVGNPFLNDLAGPNVVTLPDGTRKALDFSVVPSHRASGGLRRLEANWDERPRESIRDLTEEEYGRVLSNFRDKMNIKEIPSVMHEPLARRRAAAKWRDDLGAGTAPSDVGFGGMGIRQGAKKDEAAILRQLKGSQPKEKQPLPGPAPTATRAPEGAGFAPAKKRSLLKPIGIGVGTLVPIGIAAHLLRKKKETEEPEMQKAAALGTIARDFSRGVLPGALGGSLVGAGVGAGSAEEGERMRGAGRGALIGALSGGLAGGGLRAGLMPKLRGVKERAFNKAQAQAEEMGRRADLTEAVAKHWGTRMDDITREARKATGPRQQQLRNEWAEATEKFDEAVNVTTDFRAAQRTAQDEMAAQSGPVTLPGIVPGTVGGLIAAPMAYFGRKKEKTGAPLRPGVLGRLGDFGAGALPGAAGGAIGGGLLGTRDFVVGEDASEADRLRSGLRGAAIGALAGGSISGAMSGMARHTQRLENAQDLKRYAADVAHHKRNARDSAAEIERLIKNEPAGRQSTEEWWQWKQDLNRAQSDHRTATEGAGMYEGFVRDMEREPAIRFKPGVMGGIGAAMGIPAAYLGRKKEPEQAKTAGAGKSYGPGGKWIHDRAHRIMEEGETEKQYGKKDGKSVAYAIAAQQSHRLGKSPKGFRTAEGVRTARRKYDRPRKEYQKTAGLVGPNGLTTEGALFLLRQPSPNLEKVAAAASVPTKKLDPKRAKDLLRKLLGEPAGGVNPLNPGSGIKGMLTKNRMM